MKTSTPTAILLLVSLAFLGCNEDSPTDAPDTDGHAHDLGSTNGGRDTGDAVRDSGEADSGEVDAGALDMAATDMGAGAGDMSEDVGPDSTLGDAGIVLPERSYVIRRDMRRCAASLCGGWWLRSANERTTACADGTTAEECYVAEIDWAGTAYGVDEIARAESAVGGTIIDGIISNGVVFGTEIGVVAAQAAWIAEWGQPVADAGNSDFYQLKDNGLQCVVEPCFHIDTTLLNVATMGAVSRVDLSGAGATSTQEGLGVDAMFDGDLRATGKISTDDTPGPAGDFGETFYATQFYLPLR